MNTINATFDIPQAIQDGLRNGKYERVGGIIRNTQTNLIVAWLRENHVRHAMNIVPSLNAALPFLGVLNLAVSVGGLALVLGRLRSLETGLKGLDQKVTEIGRKIDFGNYANVASAIQQANSAFTMSNSRNREASAMQAIDRLLVAEHYFTNLLDEKIKGDTAEEGGNELLSTICLAYTAEALCYLELDEPRVAMDRLNTALTETRERRFEICIRMLSLYDAPFLHPYILAKEPKNIVERLHAIHKTIYEDESVQEMVRRHNIKFISKPGKYTAERDWDRLDANVRRYLDIMETSLEDGDRLEFYGTEIQVMMNKGVNWREWCEAKPPTSKPSADHFLILT